MSDPRYLVIRRPRHSARSDDQSQVWLECSSEPCQRREAQLVDFSRMGAKFEVTAPLALDESFRVRIQQAAHAVDITLPAVVRWQRIEGDHGWMMGCLFEQEVPYEVVGELFLSGLLSTDELG